MTAATALLNWDASQLRKSGDFVITNYVAIKAKTRRNCKPLTDDEQERLDSWESRGRRGVIVKITKRPAKSGPAGLLLSPKAFGFEFGLDTRMVEWVREQGPVTMRLIPSKPREKYMFTIVVFKDRDVIGFLAPQRRFD